MARDDNGHDLGSLWSFAHELDKRLVQVEGRQMSHAEDLRNAVSHGLATAAIVDQIKPGIEREKQWQEDKRRILIHVVCWCTPLFLLWFLSMFGGGFRTWVKLWLGT